uniref:Intermediate filament family orphan 1a n=1 Tax=Gasterosteus aculeatus TaxID=69293 RepID=G3Q4F0_GASAC
KRERDEYKLRWEEEYSARMDLQEKVAELEEDLQESEVSQDELALRVKQLKAELVLFKGLVSSVSFKQSSAGAVDGDEASASESEGGGARDEESCSTSASQINEQMQRMLNQSRRECEFEDDCDSLAWEETEETLLLWEDFPGYPLGVETQGEQEESIEEVIKDTECLFKSREKEYQETIDQIELDLATAKSDMNRHLHEYMEMCSMKRGLDVQMETCRRLITRSATGEKHDPSSFATS